jgi:hypothetical protein
VRIRRRLNGKKSRVEREDGFVDGSVEAAKLAGFCGEVGGESR